jgi:predicted ATPase
MITRIEVNGFKTLNEFSLDFTPGLNILVGPNGAGKTNLVSFFEFLSNLIDAEASEATSRSGGAGAVFRRLGKDDYENLISVKLSGCVRAPERPQQGKEEPRPRFVLYQLGFSLVFPESRDVVLFSNQALKASVVRQFVPSQDEHGGKWDIDIASIIQSDGTAKASVREVTPMFLERWAHLKNKDASRQLEELLTSMLTENVPLIALMARFSDVFWAISEDLRAGKVYNIVPSRIKLPEDSAKPPGIDRDGSGLSATLYAIFRSKDPEEYGRWHPYFYAPRRRRTFVDSHLDQLRSYLSIVNASIEDFSVTNDPFDNQLRVRFQIRSGQYGAQVPLALMSDGTLKWIALVTAALTTRAIFSIEEPENYLHPQMQGQLVGILREILFREDEYRMTLMTTHSETLLNQCLPEELVIVGMENGRTTAVRCNNADDVTHEIERTGFGLGYYYVSNALHY